MTVFKGTMTQETDVLFFVTNTYLVALYLVARLPLLNYISCFYSVATIESQFQM
jgi:hypothetical protein